MRDKFLQSFRARLRELGIERMLPPEGRNLIEWSITERKRVKRHRALSFRFSERSVKKLARLAEETGASRTEILEKLIFLADYLMQLPAWEESSAEVQKERMHVITVRTVCLCPRRPGNQDKP